MNRRTYSKPGIVRTQPLTEYEALLKKLLADRQGAGGELSEANESRYVELLDDCWAQLSSSERARIEQKLLGRSTTVMVSDLLSPVLVELAPRLCNSPCNALLVLGYQVARCPCCHVEAASGTPRCYVLPGSDGAR